MSSDTASRSASGGESSSSVEIALKYIEHDLNVIPVLVDGTKRPACNWRQYQNRMLTHQEAQQLFGGSKRVGFAIICGLISKFVEVIDFDVDAEAKYSAWIALLNERGHSELLNRLVVVRTPRPGYHLHYRCPEGIEDHLILAQRLISEGTIKTLIETRGEGCIAIAPMSPPAVHPSGRTYDVIQGDIFNPPQLTADERILLLNTARELNEYAKPEPKPRESRNDSDDLPGTDFNERANWDEILLPHGWTRAGGSVSSFYYRHPRKSKPGHCASAQIGGHELFRVFCDDGGVFEQNTSYSKFAACTMLSHGGDFSAAARQLAKDGYGGSGKSPTVEDSWSEKPRPLMREISKAPEFPLAALGKVLGDAARIMHSVVQAPQAICGQSVIAAATTAAQGHADVEMDGRRFPISEDFITISPSGERKSAVDREAIRPIHEHERDLAREYRHELEEYNLRKEAYNKAKKEKLAKDNESIDSKMAAVRGLGDEPEEPLQPVLLIEEPTYEGLVKLLDTGQPAVGLFSDEGGRFFGGHAMSQENVVKTAAGLSSLWDGRTITRSRAGEGTKILYGKRVTLHLMLQPVVAQQVLSHHILQGQGLLSRFLISWPDSTAGTRLYNAVNICESEAMRSYIRKIAAVLEYPLPITPGTRNELEPRCIELCTQAKSVWVTFHDEVESQLRRGGKFEAIPGFANKAPEHAARLAGTLSIIDNIRCSKVAEEHMIAGITLVRYYLEEALRLHSSGAIDQKIYNADALLKWLHKRQRKSISLVEIYQRGPAFVRQASTARELMKILIEHGWARISNEGVEFDGTHRHEAYEIRIPAGSKFSQYLWED